MDLQEGVCAGCGKSLGIPADWRLIEGRAYHHSCEPAPPPADPPERKVQSLGEFVERKARNVMHGRGQRTFEEDSDDDS